MILLPFALSLLFADPSGGCLPDPRQLWQLPADSPTLLEVLTRHGVLCREQGQFRQAENLLERVVLLVEHGHGKDAPNLAGPLSNLAVVYRDQGRRAEAEPMLQRALRLSTHDDRRTRAFIENNLALLYWDRGDQVRAEPLLRKAVDDADENVRDKMRINLATLYWTTGRLAASESIAFEVLAVDRDCWQAWRNLAAIHRLRRDIAKAADAIARAMALAKEASPEQAETLFEKAQLAWLSRDWSGARTAVEAAITIEESLFGAGSVNLIPYVELHARVLHQVKAKPQAKEAALRARLLRAAL